MVSNSNNWLLCAICFIIALCIVLAFYYFSKYKIVEPLDPGALTEYIQRFHNADHRIFPFRYFTDNNGTVLPFVAVTAFFRSEEAKKRFYEYKEKGIHIFGITAYKSFPKRELLDKSEGEYERTDTFDYAGNIRDWLCCFSDKATYGFSSYNNMIDISESDFYDSEADDPNRAKKYDFIYICNKDSDKCPLDGWNAVNRNFDLALKCFPIMCNEFQMKGLVVGRVGCGLEEKYGDKLEVVDWLDLHVLQEKMRDTKFLFVPNVFDASPRVIAEAMTKDLPVLMNKHILCGSKYINYDTGEFFSSETDLRPALTNLINKLFKISPKKWWKNNYSQEKSQARLREFLNTAFPSSLDKVDRVKFIL